MWEEVTRGSERGRWRSLGPSWRVATAGKLFPNVAGEQNHFKNADIGWYLQWWNLMTPSFLSKILILLCIMKILSCYQRFSKPLFSLVAKYFILWTCYSVAIRSCILDMYRSVYVELLYTSLFIIYDFIFYHFNRIFDKKWIYGIMGLNSMYIKVSWHW